MSKTWGTGRGFPPSVRRAALAIAGDRCQATMATTGMRCPEVAHHVDHITPHSLGGSDDLDNAQALCAWHHARKWGREGGQARAFKSRSKRFRAPEKHPGSLA